ncbi:MAG: hypothetical protein J6Q56_00800 [Clostridia bacterium]|nr:hypothetical protein [Clostridia bacterium]
MTGEFRILTQPKQIFSEFEKGNSFKASVGELGIFEQTKLNERFYVGDQWYGAKCGNNRPLARRNIIKRIGEYKMSVVGASPVSVRYTADGIPYNLKSKQRADEVKAKLGLGLGISPQPDNDEIALITDSLSSYQKLCAERVKFDIKNEQLLRNAYISGTGIAYTYWDNEVDTGLFADKGKRQKIKGDIAFQVLDVENVIFGDPNNDDVQSQPYILLAERLDVGSVRREAKRNGLSTADILPDGESRFNSGTRGESEPDDSRRVTVITKLFKEWDSEGEGYRVMAVKVTERAVVRKPWDIGLTMYPIAKFCWERRRTSAYGESEITYLIPNQIAINRMLTAECWSALAAGMPKLVVNGDIVGEDVKITNDPGQIIRANVGFEGSVANAMQYVSPSPWAEQYLAAVNDLSSNTMNDAGANDVALGNVRPDNAAAIIQMREAALQPLQIYQNRYYAFIEDIARIWADFWINKYGNRFIKVENDEGVEYIPFNAERYRNLVLNAKVDVGASTLWSEAVVVSTLDSLLSAGIITPSQYLERMPKGLIPKAAELADELGSAENTLTIG